MYRKQFFCNAKTHLHSLSTTQNYANQNFRLLIINKIDFQLLYNIYPKPIQTKKSSKIDLTISQKLDLGSTNLYGMKQIIFVIFSSICNVVFASYPLVNNYYRSAYKAGTQNWDIVQDGNNTMYFANNNGLLSFDGVRWTNRAIDAKVNLRSLHYASDGRMYVSTFNDFGYYQFHTTSASYHSISDQLNIAKKESNALYNIIEGDQKMYFWSGKTIYEYNGIELDKTAFYSEINAAAYVNQSFIVCSNQVGVFMKQGKQFIKLPGSELLINKNVCAVLSLNAKKMLFVTSLHGVYVFDGISFEPYVTGFESFLKANQVFCAAINNSHLAFGTVQNGIALLNLADKSVSFLNTSTGLQNNTVLSMTFDVQNNLWLGLDNGIDYVSVQSQVSSLMGKNSLYGAGYCSIKLQNLLYLGTNQGLYVSSYPTIDSPAAPKLNLVDGMHGQVWSLTQIDGTLFCGTDNGAFVIANNKAVKIQGLVGTWSFKAFPDRKDLILGCSYKGLFVLKKVGATWLFSHYLQGGFSESSPMFEFDKDGSLWFSHWLKGMYRLTLNATKDRFTKIELFNNHGFPTKQNNTVFKVDNELLFSSESGIFNYNPRTHRMVSNTQWNKAFANTPKFMRFHQAPNGDVWCISGKFVGLAQKQQSGTYVIDSLTYRVLQSRINAGFEHLNFLNPNKVVFATEDGFCVLKTNSNVAVKSRFKVSISNIVVDNENEGEDSLGESEAIKNSEFNNNIKSVRFEFTAPEYLSPEMVQYSYLLEGYDDEWSSFSSDNMKEYTQLSHGDYVFRVRARSLLDSSIVNCSYEFSVAPAWYETKLALAIYLIILVGLFLLGIKFFKMHSKKAALEMEQKKELEIQTQKKEFEEQHAAKKREIKELKNQQLQYELRHKAQELATSTMNVIRKNEMLLEIIDSISKLSDEIRKNSDANTLINRLSKMERSIKQNIDSDKNWKKFEDNFDLVYENYLKRLGESFPQLNVCDKKICAYIKMDLSSKDMAPLLDMSIRSIETSRYRIRQKLNLDREVNLADYLQKF